MAEQLAINGGKPVRNDFLIFGSPLIENEDVEAVSAVLKSGWLSTGPKVNEFEEMFKKYVGSDYAIATNSCTSALHLSLLSAGIGSGDEVITTPMTFAATANVILHTGAVPVFVDVEKDTFNIDPNRIEKKITPRTKAILPVHFAGRPCKMNKILEIADEHDLFIIEDAAHAIESRYHDQKIGNIGDSTCFSFYATKNLTTGEGGMITTNRKDWADKMRILELHGMSRNAWKRYSAEGFTPYDIVYPGYKYNMMDIQAAMGIHQLSRIDANLKIREKIFRKYNDAFSEIPELITPPEENDITHGRHLYTILIRPELLACDRNKLVASLQAENIGCGIHFISLHLTRYYNEAFSLKRGDFPNAEFISDRTLSIPLSAKLTEKDVDDVIAATKKVVNAYRKSP
jgi:dTDP-4-amino-4,6-dideoxygalactose transaminase